MVLSTISRHVSTSSFLLSRNKLGNGSVSESKLRGDLQVLLGMVAECYPDSLVYSLKQPSVSALSFHSKDEIIFPKLSLREKTFDSRKMYRMGQFY